MPMRNESVLEIDKLAPLQRLLLHYDGTLTDLIEALSGEPIRLRKLEHRVAAAQHSVAALELESGEPLIDRTIQLQGERSGAVYVYAQTHIAAARLPAPLRRALAASDTPLGRLCKQHRLEVFKEPIGLYRRHAHDLAACLQAAAESTILLRGYRVFSAGRPLMLLHEHFAPALWRLESVLPNRPRQPSSRIPQEHECVS
jgi:chorismate-pyruvate lyase